MLIELKYTLAMHLRGRWWRRRQTAMWRLPVSELSSEAQLRLQLLADLRN